MCVCVLQDDGNFPLFNERSAWRAVEESQLLDSVERFGFGNWEDIKTMLSGRSVDDVRTHYEQFYIDGNIGMFIFFKFHIKY